MMKTYNFIGNRMNSYKEYVPYNITDKNTLNRNKYFYIFNDYFLEELSENENLKNYLEEGIKSEKALEFIVENAKYIENKKETKKSSSKK